MDFASGAGSRLEWRSGCGGLYCCTRRLVSFVCALVVPERPATEQQQQRENRKLGGTDALLAAIAVVVRDH